MGMGWLLNRRGTRHRSPPTYRQVQVKRVLLVGGSEPASAKLWKGMIQPLRLVFRGRGWGLVYCGMGQGLAGALARAILEDGGRVEAVVVRGAEPPDVPEEAQRIVVADFHERQRVLFDRGDAALVLPGGLGTLAELTQLMAWRAAGLYPKPLVVHDPGGWFGRVHELIRQGRKDRVIRLARKQLFGAARTPERVGFLIENELV